ncbi:MAG: spermidine/putrescine transport system substrate-binding protein [Actinomycetota bacterium]|nr:spermidine/putrescine transport system substrate-binding protein [Actinomycetota bacterium]
MEQRPKGPRDTTELSRREWLRLMGRTGAGAAALATLAACGVDSAQPITRSQPSLPPLAGELVIAQWPGYIDKATVPAFESAMDIDVAYKTVINDNAAFYATIRESLSQGKSTGWDLVTLSDWVVSKMNRTNTLLELDHSLLPHVTANIGEAFADPVYDPGNAHSIPWQGGMTGIAFNRNKIPEGITSFDDLWDESLKGHVGMLTEMVDTMNLTLLTLGIDPQEATVDDAKKAQAKLIEQREAGIPRGYYGNNYIDGLARGDLWASMAWSGDVFWLGQDEIEFVIPSEGGLLWVTPMEIPLGAEHPRDAHAFLDYVYRPEVAADITSYVGYITPVPGTQEILSKRAAAAEKPADKAYLSKLANSEYVFPTAEMHSQLHSYKVLSADEDQAWNDLFSDVTLNG